MTTLTLEEIRADVESLDGVLTLHPAPGDGTPEVAWGDLFFYYAPDGVVPSAQPFATVVTKDYPGEPSSGLGAGVSGSTWTPAVATRTPALTRPARTR